MIRRRLFNLAALLSALLCLACLGMWLRSGSKLDLLQVVGASRYVWAISSSRGNALFADAFVPASVPVTSNATWGLDLPPGWEWNWPALQQRVGTYAAGNLWTRRVVLLPYWLLVLVLGILPACWVWRWRRERRQRGRGRRGFEVEAASSITRRVT